MWSRAAVAGLAVCVAAGFFATAAAEGEGSAAKPLRLATTTSLDNSGLLEYLRADLQTACRCRLAIIPVGSGKALAMARRGDADLLITHAPADEQAFVAAGYGVDYHPIAYNHFVILSPTSQPAAAGEGALAPPLKLLADIARTQQRFISRGDDSGTHKKEQQLWAAVQQQNPELEVDSTQAWYVSAGIGMAQAIIMADELRGHVLSDYGTYLFLRDKVDLHITSQPADEMKNVYSIMRANPERFPHTQTAAAQAIVQWLTSTASAQKINAFRVGIDDGDGSDEQLFHAANRTKTQRHSNKHADSPLGLSAQTRAGGRADASQSTPLAGD